MERPIIHSDVRFLRFPSRRAAARHQPQRNLYDTFAHRVPVEPPLQLLPGGFTDTVGRKRHNDKLSIARAQAVAGELVQNGVAPGRIEARGFGERDLAVPTADQVDEAKNRRVVVRIASN